jgi:IS5 family transposase
LWDEALPVEVRELTEDLAALDRLLSDPRVLEPIVAHWRRELVETKRSVIADGRPTIAMETFVRLMVLKARHGWGYRTLVVEVSDSIHLRRFCRIALCERVPDESTIRKLTKRIGDETVSDVTRVLIGAAVRERRFTARAVRIDSTVTDADIKDPTDAGLASAGVRALAREGRRLAGRIQQPELRVRDRSRSMGRTLRAIGRTIRRRSGEAKTEVLELTAKTGKLLERSIREARAVAAAARAAARACRAAARAPSRPGGSSTTNAVLRGSTEFSQVIAVRRNPSPRQLTGSPTRRA